MNTSIRLLHRTFRIKAAAVVVAFGLVATPTVDIGLPQRAPSLQVQTLAVDLAAVSYATAASTTSGRQAAATPQINVALPTPQQVGATIALLAVAAAWYATFPVTLPASVVAGVLINVLIRGISMQPINLDPVLIIGSALTAFVAAPLFLVSPLLSLTSPKPSATRAATTKSAVTAKSPRSADGLAGSQRTADRTPTAHRAAKSAPKSTTTKSAAGGSGRDRKQ